MKNEFQSEREIQLEILKELREIKSNIHGRDKHIAAEIGVIDNSELLQAMNISNKTAATWRNTEVLRYTKIGSKFYYLIADIKSMLRERFDRH